MDDNKVVRWNPPRGTTIAESPVGEFVYATDHIQSHECGLELEIQRFEQTFGVMDMPARFNAYLGVYTTTEELSVENSDLLNMLNTMLKGWLGCAEYRAKHYGKTE